MKNWHIVYLSFESEKTGRDYIGKHSTLNLHDGYLGSYRDPSFTPDSRIILGYYKSAQDAIVAEIQWQRVFRVVEDPKFANKSYQTSKGFDTTGATVSPELKQILSEKMSGGGNPMFGCCGDLAPATHMRWYYDPETKIECYSKLCPSGFLPGRPSMAEPENVSKRHENQEYCKGEKNGMCKIKKNQVPEIIAMKQSKQYTVKEIASIFGVSPGTIYKITNKRGTHWTSK